MPERREPTISSSVRSDHEEHVPRKTQADASEVLHSRDHGLHADTPRSRGPAPRSSASNSKTGAFGFFFAIVALAASGFLYWQSIEFQASLQKTLSLSEARIVELESKLALTGDEANASVTALQAKIKWADSEIRKLWAVSYDTNRKAISDNADAITVVNQQIKGVDTKIKNATKNVETDIKLLNELVDTQQVSLAQIEQKMSSVKTSVEKMIQENTALKNRIDNNEQAIQAIDAFRRTVNQQLLQLKGATP